jgi:hypothetical protein
LRSRISSLVATLAAAVLAFGVSAPTTGVEQSPVVVRDPLRLAEGILVQPDVSQLESPSIADENDEQDGGHDNAGYEDGSDRAPVVIAPEVPVDAVPRGDETRQEELEMPDGPGIKY